MNARPVSFLIAASLLSAAGCSIPVNAKSPCVSDPVGSNGVVATRKSQGVESRTDVMKALREAIDFLEAFKKEHGYLPVIPGHAWGPADRVPLTYTFGRGEFEPCGPTTKPTSLQTQPATE